MPGRAAWRRSLRWRLLAATLAALLLALVLAGLVLAGLFRGHVLRQSVALLTTQLDQVTARLEFNADGRPGLDADSLSDPRWSRPQSGLYWQVDRAGDDGHAAPERGVLRSRSLWDAALHLPADALADGEVHVHELAGPRGEPLLVVERTVRRGAEGAGRWRLAVAADLGETEAAVRRFNGVLALSLASLLVLLAAAAWAQVSVGLAPLRALQRSLADVRDGRAPRLHEGVPAEVQPLVDDFNTVLERNAELVRRARTQAGDLAHALKTPLAVLQQAAATAARAEDGAAELARLVHEQAGLAQRQVERHLARARAAAAAQGLPGVRTAVAPVLAALVRVMCKVHAARALAIDVSVVDERCTFAGEAEDLHEIVGNVLDNACRWARHRVRIVAGPEAGSVPARIRIDIADDGPGIAEDRREAALARGTRLDESMPGSGLGLSIARDLVELYGGTLVLLGEPPAGLSVRIRLPAAAAGFSFASGLSPDPSAAPAPPGAGRPPPA
ncbi:MAG: ATP-binding protein [Rubrivivax sp.]|nr:ATP-binding protein [Rubrivivax sp.]